MIGKSRFVFLITVALILLSASLSYAFFFGTAKATGTVEDLNTAKYADIVEKTGTGGLSVLSVEVLDKFGHPKRVTWKVVRGATSTSPTLEFTPPLEKGDYVSIELKTGNAGDHGYLDLNFKK